MENEALQQILSRFDAVDKQFDTIGKRLDAVDKRLDAVDKRLNILESKIDEANENIKFIWEDISRHDRRFERLESIS